ncbi:MAG: histidine kinase dimerization/phospho-acceptor domain-containing protein [Patescibacteria group bacterium]
MDIIVYSYLPSIIGLTILGYLVYQNNPTATSNRLLGLLSATLAAWLLALMLSDTASSESTASVWLNIALGVGTPVGTVFLLFSNYFPYKSVSFSKVMLMIIAFINAVFIAAATAGLLITGVSLDSSGVNIEAASVLYSLQSLFVIGQVLASLWLLVRKRGRASIRQKAQIRMVFYGIASILTVNGIVGLILLGQDIPSALNALLTGASALIFISFISTAIIRHGMFDIRRTISRLLAHTFSVVFIVSAVSFVSSQIINTRISNDRERTLAIGLVVALSITVFPYVKRLFDSLSLKLFYQSAYVTRDVLAELSQELVKEIEIQTTLNNGLHVLGEALKPKSIHSYIVMSGQNLVQKARFGSAPKLPNKIITLLQEIREPQIVDLMEETEVKLALIRNGIEIVSVIENQGNIIGYLLYGHKSSGSVYTRQDLQLINTAGNNIGVAITNSLNFAEIQEFNTRLASEVKEATKQLRKTNRALEQSDQAKSDLISMASHQLRPQITASKGFVGMLIVDKDVKLKKSQQELLDYAHEGLGRMSSIVVDMLDMSKIDGGTLTGCQR